MTSVDAAGPPPPPPPPVLRQRPVRAGERWIYSAGFNVPRGLPDTSRIDTELADIEYLAAAGASVAVLSHRGRAGDGSAGGLEDIAAHMGAELGRPVGYFSENASEAAAAAASAQRPGDITVFGNTRHHDGEARNDPALARAFSRLGEFVAVGGFSKAHRRHASNVGILSFRPGWAAGSLSDECSLLAPWSGRTPGLRSLAVLGGVKPEKTLVGLPCFAADYDIVVPGGVVLNHLLRAIGYDVGDSLLGEQPEDCAAMTQRVLRESSSRVHIPQRVVVARRCAGAYRDAQEIDIADGVPAGFGIVDFHCEPWLEACLAEMAEAGGRLVVAGTPSLYTQGFGSSCVPLLEAASQAGVTSVLMGGDTVSELPFAGVTSTGGGAALHFLRYQDLPVLEALRQAHSPLADRAPSVDA